MNKVFLDAAFSFSLMLGSVYLWFAADAFPRLARYKGFDSDFWPKIVLAAIALVALVLCCQSLRAYKHVRAEIRTRKGIPAKQAVEFDRVKLVLTALLVLSYFYGLQTLGFLIATFIFLTLAIRLVGYGNRLWLALYPFGFTVLLGIIFVKGLSLPLPRGTGMFETFNRLFF